MDGETESSTVTETQEMRVTVEGLLKRRSWLGWGSVKPAEFSFDDLSLVLEPASDPEQPKLIALIGAVGGGDLPREFIDALEKMQGYRYHYEKCPANVVYISEAEDEEANTRH